MVILSPLMPEQADAMAWQDAVASSMRLPYMLADASSRMWRLVLMATASVFWMKTFGFPVLILNSFAVLSRPLVEG
ncbi:MAG: hypothetical protein V8Q91_04540 [Bilophila wadsworthia]|uniref:hypothetical protein n=2 Tax=Bilophila wadsworthia TaxID=35833 RepID=UPI00300EE468